MLPASIDILSSSVMLPGCLCDVTRGANTSLTPVTIVTNQPGIVKDTHNTTSLLARCLNSAFFFPSAACYEWGVLPIIAMDVSAVWNVFKNALTVSLPPPDSARLELDYKRDVQKSHSPTFRCFPATECRINCRIALCSRLRMLLSLYKKAPARSDALMYSKAKLSTCGDAAETGMTRHHWPETRRSRQCQKKLSASCTAAESDGE